jgi:hypothetical protein
MDRYMKIYSFLLILLVPFLSSGQIIKRTIKMTHTISDSSNLTVDKTEISYDSSGNIIYENFSYSSNKIDFTSAGFHKAKFENGRLRYFEFYDYRDTLQYYEIYEKNDSIETSKQFIDTTINTKHRHYNTKNQLIRLNTGKDNIYLTYNESGKILSEKSNTYFVKFEYNTEGNVILISTSLGSLSIEYLEFNSNGDWINSKETHNFDDEKITLTSREIVYY